MGKRKKRKNKPRTGKRAKGRKNARPSRGAKSSGRQQVALALDYYWRPFTLLHRDLAQSGFQMPESHAHRASFWALVPPGFYEPLQARPLLLAYATSLEARIGPLLSGASLGYWLHFYRRLSPSPIGGQRSEVTIALTRAVFEAAFQKYASLSTCDRFRRSDEIGIEKVLGGLLLSEEFQLERRIVEAEPQYVLADLSTQHLREVYDIELLAYEMWWTGASLRANGKGAGLSVGAADEPVQDVRTEELDTLIKRFDARRGYGMSLGVSATGTVFDKAPTKGTVFLPSYNVSRTWLDNRADPFFRLFGIRLAQPFQPNFFWTPFQLKSYYDAHRPLEDAFATKYGVSLLSVLAVVASLGFRLLFVWHETKGQRLVRDWMRAYEGPFDRATARNEILVFLDQAKQLLGVGPKEWASVDIDAAMAFWELTPQRREEVDLIYPGPHSIFLPHGDGKVFIDYAWIQRRLFDLFIGVSIPDQNFKGTALEESVHEGKSVLPTGPCTAQSGERKQIDAAFRVGNRLVVVECKSVSRSIAFERGEPDAIRYRNRTVDRALSDADDKASWLALHPKGRNYDITWAEAIVPVGVTPFVQFIASSDQRYWLTDTLPRVLTPHELGGLLANGTVGRLDSNLVRLK